VYSGQTYRDRRLAFLELLRLHQFSVWAVDVLEQLVVGTLLQHHAVSRSVDHLRVLDCAQAMRSSDCSATFASFVGRILYDTFGTSIKGGSGLVELENLGSETIARAMAIRSF
jgi:hypothetical protein